MIILQLTKPKIHLDFEVRHFPEKIEHCLSTESEHLFCRHLFKFFLSKRLRRRYLVRFLAKFFFRHFLASLEFFVIQSEY